MHIGLTHKIDTHTHIPHTFNLVDAITRLVQHRVEFGFGNAVLCRAQDEHRVGAHVVMQLQSGLAFMSNYPCSAHPHGMLY